MKSKLRFPRIRLPSLPLLGDIAFLVAGVCMFARGLWLVYPPAMWIVCGGLFIWWGLPPRGEGKK